MEDLRKDDYVAREINDDELDEVTGGTEIYPSDSMVFKHAPGKKPMSKSAIATGAQRKKKAKGLVFGKATDHTLDDSSIMKA